MTLKDTPIRRKLMSVMLITSSVVLVLMCSTYIAFEYYTFRNGVRKYVSTLGGIIASNSSAALAFDSRKDATEILNALKADRNIQAASLYDSKGRLFAKYPDSIATSALPASPGKEGYYFKKGSFIGFQPVVQQGERLGTLYIVSDMETMYNRLHYILFMTVLLTAIALLVAYLLSNYLQKAISIPILELEKTARVVSEQQNYALRATKMSGDEIGSLTDAFNQMLAQIEKQNLELKHEEIRKNDFIAIVSHELKTPLTSIKSYIQILLGLAKKENAEFQISALTKAENQVRKMTNLVHDFLSIARLEGGNIELNKEVFDLQPLIEELVSEAPFLSAVHQVHCDPCAGINIYGDREKIGQVLNNLLSNAIKYSPLGGNILIGITPMGSKVRISVKDNGVGINIEDQRKLFTRFYRVKNEKVKNVSGFGIGLYLVAEIVRYHGSTIYLESKEGEGSTFYFDMDISN